jgi:hypothetical protein
MSHSAYEPPSPDPREASSSSSTIWIVILVLVLVIGLPIVGVAVLFLGCCGMMGLGAYSAMQIPGEMARQQYANHPVVREHVGEVQSVSMNIAATADEQQQAGDDLPPGTTIMVFDVRGSKGTGKIVAQQRAGADAKAMFSNAKLRTDEGEFPLN